MACSKLETTEGYQSVRHGSVSYRCPDCAGRPAKMVQAARQPATTRPKTKRKAAGRVLAVEDSASPDPRENVVWHRLPWKNMRPYMDAIDIFWNHCPVIPVSSNFQKDSARFSKPLVAIPVRPVLLGAPDFITPATMAVHEPKVDASSCKVLWWTLEFMAILLGY